MDIPWTWLPLLLLRGKHRFLPSETPVCITCRVRKLIYPAIRYGAEVGVGDHVNRGMSKSSDFFKSQLAEGHTIYGKCR